jgi:hypothetical protein
MITAVEWLFVWPSGGAIGPARIEVQSFDKGTQTVKLKMCLHN